MIKYLSHLEISEAVIDLIDLENINHRFWQPDHYQQLELCRTYEEMADLALTILDKMPQPVGMISGPISTGGFGMKNNLRIFSRAIEKISEKFTIFDQLPFEPKMCEIIVQKNKKYDRNLLERFYLPILRSGRIKILFFLPNWWQSKGSFWEHEKVKELGLGRFYLEWHHIGLEGRKLKKFLAKAV